MSCKLQYLLLSGVPALNPNFTAAKDYLIVVEVEILFGGYVLNGG